jgi:hypothetical protein
MTLAFLLCLPSLPNTLCMYVCVCAYVCMYVCMYVYACMYVYVCVCVYGYVLVSFCLSVRGFCVFQGRKRSYTLAAALR